VGSGVLVGFSSNRLEGLVASSVSPRPWRLSEQGFPGTFPIQEQLRFLIRYAILAPSTRNSQPWRFRVEGNTVLLRADPDRWLPVADPSRRELHLSLGCALENLLVATASVGYRHTIAYFPEPGDRDLAAVVTFGPAPRTAPAPPPAVTLDTLEFRRTEHRPFLARPVPAPLLERLRGVPGESGLRLSLSDAGDRRRAVDVLTVRAVGTLFGNDEYRDELARAVGEGSFGGSWAANQVGRVALSHLNLARRLARQASAAIQSAPLIGVIGSLADGPMDQVRSGRLLQRLWLTATAHGLALQPISYALEVPALRQELAAHFPEAGPWPQQLVRLGYVAAHRSSDSPRRGLEAVVSTGQNGRSPHSS
jgi:nitroreductase